MHPFLKVSRGVMMVSMMLAIIQPRANAQGKDRLVKHPTFYRTINHDEIEPEIDVATLFLADAQAAVPRWTRLLDKTSDESAA
jgi:hypothetical protein